MFACSIDSESEDPSNEGSVAQSQQTGT